MTTASTAWWRWSVRFFSKRPPSGGGAIVQNPIQFPEGAEIAGGPAAPGKNPAAVLLVNLATVEQAQISLRQAGGVGGIVQLPVAEIFQVNLQLVVIHHEAFELGG